MRLLLWACILPGCFAPEPADLLLTNAEIYTLDDTRPWAQAMAVRDGRILALGDNADILARYAGPERNAQGAMVLPGFVDAHVHPLGAGIDLERCDLSASRSVSALLDTVTACADRDSGAGWLLGYGWDLSLFAGGNPDKALLDSLPITRPILLTAADGHSVWVNSLALSAAAIDADTPDPALGIIERDADGVPSGTLRESAQGLLWPLIPEPDARALDTALVRGIAVLSSFGITAVIEASASPAELVAYHRVDAAGKLNVHAEVSQTLERDAYLAQAASEDTATGNVHSRAIKIYLDGVLEGETAALLEPYLTSTATTRSTPRGRLTFEPQLVADIITAFDAAGWQVHVHAIGDRAVQTALDAFEAARQANGPTDNRHHIAHLQLVDPADYDRFAALDVTANFQAVWAFPDDYIQNINLPQVGPERVALMYPIGSLARTGARIVGGSDWNVTTPNPLVAIETALTRQDPAGSGTGVLNADERVDLDTMLRAYTVNGAWLMHRENDIGRLMPGYAADFVLLGRNLFGISPGEIAEVPILATYLAGRVVFETE